MEDKRTSHIIFKCTISVILLLVFTKLCYTVASKEQQGQWELLRNNTGVVAMHMVLTRHNTVIMFDQTGSGRSGYQLHQRHNGTRCTRTHYDLSDSSCYAHSVEYNISSNQIRPLNLETDTWCSSGSVLSNGTILQTGGFGGGYRRIRYYHPCDHNHCDWRQSKKMLSDDRWYASNLILPSDDRVIVVGGRGVFTYEFVPKLSPSEKSFDLPLLHQTYEKSQRGNNLYPFLHLSSDGNLFIFANRDSILFNYKQNKVVKTFPRMPGPGSRSYPSTGSSVILPLDNQNDFQKVEVLVCGGAAPGAYTAAKQGKFLEGMRTCGRMMITGNQHEWNMENMPGPRLMNDMVILPTGDILIINGVQHGCAGWNNAENPSFEPYLYKPKKPLGKRFSVLRSTKIARMYHSSAILLPDGRVLVAGSNPNDRYDFRNVKYPTELRLQAFVPYYMDKQYDDKRPHNVSVHNNNGHGVEYGEVFAVHFLLGRRPSNVKFEVYAPPFSTHSISMNQSMLRLNCTQMSIDKGGWVNAHLQAPPSPNVAPAGYYMLTVVNGGIPSISQWVRFMNA